MNSTMLSMRLTKDLSRSLSSLAEKLERPRSYIIRKALEVYLAEHADYRIARERLEDKTDEVISGAELRKRIGR